MSEISSGIKRAIPLKMSGHVGHLSATQKRDLAQFKERLSDALHSRHDDHLLLQFLRARRFDLKKAEEMFRRHLQFRQEFDEEYLVNEYVPPEILFKHFLPPLLGYDKAGCPVRIIKIGTADIKGVLCCFRRPEIRKLITWFLDTDKVEMKRRSKETGVWVETRTFIFDLEGLTFKQIYHKDAYELLVSCLKLYECNYPENLKIAFVINTPPFFSWIFNIAKSLLSDDTVQKLKIYGNGGWEKDMLEVIDSDILPAVYGGRRTDSNGDPRCPSLVFQGAEIPKECYLRNQKRLERGEEGVHCVVIGRRSKHVIPVRVEVPHSSICWEVDCKNGDLSLSLTFSDKALLPPCTLSSEYGLERGCHLAAETGNYSLILDNSYSILRSKTVLYRVSTFPGHS